MLEYISINQLFYNIWKQGISRLYNMYPEITNRFGFEEKCTKTEIRNTSIDKNKCLSINLLYQGRH